ncbi:hypothetical protein RO3G_15592 [Lichtheimia corymbifera JMRC:FSU:9682]|uniref:Cyclin N-terminal domain-containing protein n=1 Tax=Lichtheimia corymbifera JMRC:FSU:9682 TaxID=1263082 RepID=A0A068S6H4_9FUNG|nr:hypothetical protein RO3G_15592 [Lichtheimia corymbifera JMRC:FSU:9682]
MQQEESTLKKQPPSAITNAYNGSLEQAYLLLDAIQMNRGERLGSRCLAYLAKRVTDLWDAEPKPEPLHGVMNSLLDATPSPPPKGDLSFQTRLESFCRDTSPTLTICPSLTLLMAISYLERLKEKHTSIRGTDGCASRLVVAAYGVATKYIRANLRLITSHTGTADSNEPLTPPTPPTSDTSHNDKDIDNNSNQRALRMESELLHLLNYNLAIHEPSHLVWWSKTFEVIPDEYSHV